VTSNLSRLSQRLRFSAKSRAADELRALLAVSSEGGEGGHVVPLVEAVQSGQHLYLVMPLMEGGDLFSRVAAAGGGGLPQEEARRYFRGMVRGLLELKAHGIAHGWVSDGVCADAAEHTRWCVVSHPVEDHNGCRLSRAAYEPGHRMAHTPGHMRSCVCASPQGRQPRERGAVLGR
jgi:hypothetical protein